MNSKEILLQRIINQSIVEPKSGSAEALVGGMGCMQAQEFALAKWGIGLRVPGLSEAAVDHAFNSGQILRTHVLRPTWHFVLPRDIGWLIQFSAARIRHISQPFLRQLNIDEKILRRTKKIMEKALEGQKYLTRRELALLFQKEKINTDDIRMNFIMMDAELEGLLCSGPRTGKQFTYALLEERTSGKLELQQDEALAELTRRYFSTRGLATAQDMASWSGLTLAQVKRGLDISKKDLEQTMIHNQAYWSGGIHRNTPARLPAALLLPAYDEFAIAYKDRSDFLSLQHIKSTSYGLKPVLLVNGQITGTWKRTPAKELLHIDLTLLRPLSKTAASALKKEAHRMALFTGHRSALIHDYPSAQ